MTNKFVQPGETLTLTAPAGGVTAGLGYIIGSLFVVAQSTGAATYPFEGMVEGVFNLPKTTAQAWAEGQPVFWDATNNRCDSDPTIGQYIGVSTETVGSGAIVVGDVKLKGNGQNIQSDYQVRKRFTIAQVNAGATLVPAMPGRKIRMTDVKAIAIGGAASAVTTVDVLATQAAGSVKLAAFAQASLTQSTVLRPGVAGTTVLADGASFVANDVNTGVTVNKTGASIATSTHVDVIFSYALDVG
jgi:predicted RecA/RadA family phage recombinase